MHSCFLKSNLIPGYYGTLFPGREVAAFCAYGVTASMGYVVAFTVSPYFRTTTKTYLMIAMMIVGMLSYAVVEFKQTNSKEKKDMICGRVNATFQSEEFETHF